MKHLKTYLFLLLALFLTVATQAQASHCVTCHTDVEKLKAIARSLPQPEASAENAGKG